MPRAQFAHRARPCPAQCALPPRCSVEMSLAPAVAAVVGPLSQAASASAGVLLLGFIIFVHETGHFLAARLQGIRVKNFSIGFGPTLFNFTPKDSETEFTVRALPLGGFVAFPEHSEVDEETGTETINPDPNLLQNRPVLDRAIVISAGVVANIILAWASIFTSVAAVGVPTYTFSPGVTISNIVDVQGAGAKAGIQAGDTILKVDGQTVPQSLSNASALATKIRASKGSPIDFHIARGGSEFDLTVSPKCCTPDGSSAMGIQLVPNASITRVRPSSPTQIVSTTNAEFTRLSKQTWNGLTTLFSNFKQSSKNLTGPIGVVSMGADLARNDTAALLTFVAVISINLALINALPLPALDGGQMTFLIIEALRGAPVSMKVQEAVNQTALLVFLAFSGVLFFGDLEKLQVYSFIQKLFS